MKKGCRGDWRLIRLEQESTDSARIVFFVFKWQEYTFSTAKSIISLKHLQLFQPHFIMMVIICE